MIQRIQTVHLLIGAALIGLSLGLNTAWEYAVLTGVGMSGWYVVYAAYGLGGLAVLLALAATFFYKDRPVQSKVIGAALVVDLLLVLVMLGTLVAVALDGEAAVALAAASVPVLLVVLAYLFLHLARRGVRRDIELVRSMDRLR